MVCFSAIWSYCDVNSTPGGNNKVLVYLLEANHLSKQDAGSDENRGSHSHGTTEPSWSYFPQVQRLNTKTNAWKTCLKPHFRTSPCKAKCNQGDFIYSTKSQWSLQMDFWITHLHLFLWEVVQQWVIQIIPLCNSDPSAQQQSVKIYYWSTVSLFWKTLHSGLH